jgi:uncharacterized protein Yka (UPF0111/DUF47 family)
MDIKYTKDKEGFLSMAFHLKPRNDEFFDYFNETSQAICDGAKLLKEFVAEEGDGESNLEQLNQIEAKGDEVFSTLIQRLSDTYITPFEREDIYILGSKLNGILDYIHGIMEMMVLYNTGQNADPHIKTLVEVLEKAAIEIKGAVLDLKSLRKNYQRVLDACNNIRDYEHEGDFLYRTGIALLFENADNAIEIIKWKDIFQRLETVLDYCEDVSNILKGVAVKYV